MISARRANLPEAKGAENAGLLLHRWLSEHDLAKTAARSLLEAVSSVPAPAAYQVAYDRWQRLHVNVSDTFVLIAETTGPLAIGLGSAAPLENGLTFLAPYGVPVLPGSAIKGLCRRGAQKAKEKSLISDEQFAALFGTAGDNEASDGIVQFLDGWYVPTSVGGRPFQPDTITTHHQQYYTKRSAPPTDFDEPIPNAFLSVQAGSQFCVVVRFLPEAISQGWGSYVQSLLTWSLEHLGIGGKTNAGYGSLRIVQVVKAIQTGSISVSGGSVSVVPQAILDRIAAIRGGGDLSTCTAIFAEIDKLPESLRPQAAGHLKDRLRALKLWNPKNAEKPWYQRTEGYLAI